MVADESRSRDELAAAIALAPHTVKIITLGSLRISDARDWDPDIVMMWMQTDSAALPTRIAMLRDPNLSGIPFIAVGDSEDEARALGAHAFVRTPVPIEGVIQLLARFSALRMPLEEA
jgi:hypothetical protein